MTAESIAPSPHQAATANRIRDFRLTLGLNQGELAAKLGTTERSYQRYESGARAVTADVLRALAGLGADVAWLLTGISASGAPARQPTVDAKRLALVLETLDHELTLRHLSLPPRKRAEAAALLYRFIATQPPDSKPHVDPSALDDVIRLAG